MLLKKLALVTIAALLLAALPALAGDTVTTPVKNETAKGPEIAIFAVPGLKDEALVKNLTSALAKDDGVVAAKADAEAGKFMVTFEPAKTTPEALTKTVVSISPESKFEKVQPADPAAAKHDCGKCPSKNKCGKAK
jgi:hypothetical protein